MQWGLISHKLVEKSLCFQGSWMGLAEQGQGRGVFVQQGRHKFNQGQENIFFYAEIIHSEWKQTQITLVCELYIPHTIHRSCSKFKYKEEQKQQVWVLKYTLQPSQLDCLKVKFTLFSTTTLYFLSNEMTLVLQSSGTMMRRESLLVVCMATLPHTFNAKIKYWYIAGQ